MCMCVCVFDNDYDRQSLFIPPPLSLLFSTHLSHAAGQRRSNTGRWKGVAVPSSLAINRSDFQGYVEMWFWKKKKYHGAISQKFSSSVRSRWAVGFVLRELLLYVLSGKVLLCDKVSSETHTPPGFCFFFFFPFFSFFVQEQVKCACRVPLLRSYRSGAM